MTAGRSRTLRVLVGTSTIATCVLAASLVLSGCTSVNIGDYPDVTAKLDPEAGTVTLPLDAYAATAREGYLIEHANAVMVDHCMEKSGLDFPRADDSWDTKYIPAERRYGLWNSTEAEANGYGLPVDPVGADISHREETYPDKWWNTVEACYGSFDRIPMSVANSSDEKSPVDEGMAEARGKAQSSAEWEAAHADWVDCLSKESIKPSDDSYFVPTLPTDMATQRTYAIADVACKEKVDFVQRLADVEAKYQAAYIDGHRPELAAFREKVDHNLKRARDVVASTEAQLN